MNVAANIYLGTWQFEDTDQATQSRLIQHALSLGIDKFDTARVYDKGRAEQMLGKYAGSNSTIVSKIPALSRDSFRQIVEVYPNELIESSFEQSRRNVGDATLHVLLHNWNKEWEKDDYGQEQVLTDLRRTADKYGVEKIGVSLPNHYSGHFEKTLAYQATGIIELPFNSTSPTLNSDRIKELASSKQVLARSIFEHGGDVTDVLTKIISTLETGAQLVIGTKSTDQMTEWVTA